MEDQNWRSDSPVKWDMIESGQWIQKAVWNRWVTTMERDQSHKTPITSKWTVDFLTREGEGHKVVGDWLRERWDSIYWGKDPIGTSPDIYGTVSDTGTHNVCFQRV